MSLLPHIDVTESSGNVFADLGMDDADEALTKAELARTIDATITKQQRSRSQAAEVLGIDQSELSALLCGRLTGYSIDRLLRFLIALDLDVKIVVKPKPRAHPAAQISVDSKGWLHAPRRTSRVP